jgi:hypothetical protein
VLGSDRVDLVWRLPLGVEQADTQIRVSRHGSGRWIDPAAIPTTEQRSMVPETVVVQGAVGSIQGD